MKILLVVVLLMVGLASFLAWDQANMDEKRTNSQGKSNWELRCLSNRSDMTRDEINAHCKVGE